MNRLQQPVLQLTPVQNKISTRHSIAFRGCCQPLRWPSLPRIVWVLHKKAVQSQPVQKGSKVKPVTWVTCRWGPTGQGKLLCDIHSAFIRVLEGLDEDLMEAPTMAGYGSATDLAPQDAYRPLLGASWPELACRYLQEQGALTISQEAVDAVVRLKAGFLEQHVPHVWHTI